MSSFGNTEYFIGSSYSLACKRFTLRSRRNANVAARHGGPQFTPLSAFQPASACLPHLPIHRYQELATPYSVLQASHLVNNDHCCLPARGFSYIGISWHPATMRFGIGTIIFQQSGCERERESGRERDRERTRSLNII